MAMRGARLIQLTSRTISTLLFKVLGVWAICNAEMMAMIFFFFNRYKNKIAWSGDIAHDLKGDCFAPGSPFCKVCNSAPLCVNLCVTHMYYVMHK